MRCQNCGRNNANVFYTQIINGRKSQVHLCDECAGELNMLSGFTNNFDFGFDRMFSNFFDDFGNIGLLDVPKITFKIDNPLLEDDYYDRGNPELDEALKNITSKNKGLTKKEKLENELKECIKNEKYERAAEIRDELKKYKMD